jgi:hypothetical protein
MLVDLWSARPERELLVVLQNPSATDLSSTYSKRGAAINQQARTVRRTEPNFGHHAV